MFLQKLSSTKKYTCYAFASIFVWVFMIQSYKLYKNFRSSRLQSAIVHNERQQSALKKQNERFSVTNYLNEAFNDFRVSAYYAKGREHYHYLTCSHENLSSFVTDVNGLIPSMRKNRPIIDSDTADKLSIFRGPSSNPADSYCNKLCSKFGIEDPLSQYNLFMLIAATNNDPEKIKWTQKTIKALTKDIDHLYKIQSILKELEEINCDLIDFYLRDKYPFRKFQLIKMTIRAELLVQKFFLDIGEYVGWDIRKLLEESDLGVWFLKMMLLHEADLECMIRLDRMREAFEMWWHTVVYIFSFGKIENGFGNKEEKGRRYEVPLFSTGVVYSVINFIFKAIMYIPDSIRGVDRGKEFGLLNVLSSDNFDTKAVIDWAYLIATGFFYYTKVIIKDPIDLIQSNIINAYKDIPRRYGNYEEATKEGLKLLKQFKQLDKLLKKLEKTIQKNDELAELLKPYLKPIKNLLHNKRFKTLRTVLRETKKIRATSITWGELFNPFNLKSTNILRLVKILDGLNERQERAWMSAVASASCISTLVSIASFYSSNAKKKNNRLGFCMVDLIENENPTERSTPKIASEGMHSILFDPKTVVKNDFGNSYHPRTSEERTMVLNGPNGSGKSGYMRTIAETQLLFQSIGFAFADRVAATPVNYIRFIANITDNQSQNLSLMMAEAKIIDENVLRLVDGMGENEKALFFFDEPAKGTPHDEGTKWVISIIAYLANAKNNTTVVSTHLTDIFDVADQARYHNIAPFTPEFDPKNGFTYKVKPGSGENPISIYVLEKINFHPVVLDTTTALLAEDENYRFRDKIIKKKGTSIITTLLDSSSLERLLVLIFFLLLGMLLGLFLPTITDRIRKFLEASKSKIRK